MMYLTNLKNHLTENLERCMIRAVVALYPGISRNGKWAIINGIMKDRKREDEVGSVDKKASSVCMKEAAGVRAAMQEPRAGGGVGSSNRQDIRVEKRQGKILSPRPAIFRVFGPRTRTQGGDEAEWRKMKSGRDRRLS